MTQGGGKKKNKKKRKEKGKHLCSSTVSSKCMIVSIMCACHVGPQGSKVHHIILGPERRPHHEAQKAIRIQEEHCASDGAHIHNYPGIAFQRLKMVGKQ